MAVRDPEQRRAVDDHVLVIHLLDRLEERREGLAEEQLGRVGNAGPARDHVQVVADSSDDRVDALVDRGRQLVGREPFEEAATRMSLSPVRAAS
jgi:hypothetical protein